MNVTAYKPLTPQALTARWRELLDDPDAPERCELDEFGEVHVNPPPTFKHQRIVAALGPQIESALGGEVGSYALQTSIGVRFPDLCWARNFEELTRSGGGADPLLEMPSICVEVISRWDKRKKVNENVQASLAAGVQEVILIETDARIRYFTSGGEQSGSMFGLQLQVPSHTYPL